MSIPKRKPSEPAQAVPAPAKPKAKRANAKSKLVAEWTEQYAGFIAAVQRRFDFLVESYDFAAANVTVVPPECNLSYERADGLAVRISSEYHGAPYLVLRGGEPLGAFGFFRFIALLEPGYAEKQPKTSSSIPDPATMDALLAYHADFLKAHAGEIFEHPVDLFARIRAERGNILD